MTEQPSHPFVVTAVMVSECDTIITYLGPGRTPAKSPIEYTVPVGSDGTAALRIVRKMLFDAAGEALENPAIIANTQQAQDPDTVSALETRIGDFVCDSVAAALGHYKAGYASYERMERHLDDQAREIVWRIRKLAGHNPSRDLPVPETLRPKQWLDSIHKGTGRNQVADRESITPLDKPASVPMFTDSNDRLATEVHALQATMVELRKAIDDLTLTIHSDWGRGQMDPLLHDAPEYMRPHSDTGGTKP